LDFVEAGRNGWIAEPDPQSLASAMNELWTSSGSRLTEMGREGNRIYGAKNISWDSILERLL